MGIYSRFCMNNTCEAPDTAISHHPPRFIGYDGRLRRQTAPTDVTTNRELAPQGYFIIQNSVCLSVFREAMVRHLLRAYRDEI